MTVDRKAALAELAEIMSEVLGTNTIVPEEAFAHMCDEEFLDCITAMKEDFSNGSLSFSEAQPVDFEAIRANEPELFEQLKQSMAAQGLDIEAELTALAMDKQGTAPGSSSIN